MKGEHWTSYIPTPPFPEHVSGHSTFSASAATILQCYTGSDNFGGCTIIEKGCSVIEKGITPRSDIRLEWATFSEAVEEAGISTLLGGIHFAKANIEGQQMGRKIGKAVWDKAMFYFNH